MDWTRGYSSEWTVMAVDRDTWADAGIVEGVREVSISRDCTDSVPLLETGTMTLDADSFEWEWCRIYMVANQVAPVKVAIATMLFERQSSHFEKGARTLNARGRSVLQPVADRSMTRGSYAPAGTNGANFVANLLRECTPAPVNVDGSFTLVDDVVFDLGCSYLDAVWAVLNAANWCMQIDGDGTINIRKMPTEPSLELSRANAGVLIPGIDDDYSIVDIPNRYIAVDDGEIAMATNDSGSEASYNKRGRWVDYVDESPVLVDGETLQSYADRKLVEMSTIMRKYSYQREYWPDVVPYSIVRATMPNNGIDGDLRVLSQSLECGRGVVISEVSGMEVVL